MIAGCHVLPHNDTQTSSSKQWAVQMILTSLLLQITVWGHVSGENRSHQSQDYGQETFHHQNRSGWWHNPEAEKLCGRWGGRHQRYCQQREGVEDEDNHSPEHWEGQSPLQANDIQSQWYVFANSLSWQQSVVFPKMSDCLSCILTCTLAQYWTSISVLTGSLHRL